MSKNKKAGKKHNPNRPRSKNNPDGRRNDPETDWSKYNKGRRSEDRRFIRWMRRIACIAHEILGTAPGTRDRRVSAILVSMLKSEENLSYWGLIKHFDRHPDYLELCGLSKPYCRSWYQLRISEIDPAVLQKIITRIVGDDIVHGTLLVDSSGFQHSQIHGLAERKVRQAQREAVLQTAHHAHAARHDVRRRRHPGKCKRLAVPACDGGHAPEVDGDVLADASCGGVKNCNAVRDSGRRAVIDSKSNAVIRGFNARAEMLRFREEHPGTFHRLLRLRNNIESVFSSMKTRFGGVVRALKERTQSVELLSMTICYNMAFA